LHILLESEGVEVAKGMDELAWLCMKVGFECLCAFGPGFGPNFLLIPLSLAVVFDSLLILYLRDMVSGWADLTLSHRITICYQVYLQKCASMVIGAFPIWARHGSICPRSTVRADW